MIGEQPPSIRDRIGNILMAVGPSSVITNRSHLENVIKGQCQKILDELDAMPTLEYWMAVNADGTRSKQCPEGDDVFRPVLDRDE